MLILIIGFGSIAKKHLTAINELQPGALVYALRSSTSAQEPSVINIYRYEELPGIPDFIIVSNPTKYHQEAILKSLDFGCPLFIEKPVLKDPSEAEPIMDRLRSGNAATYIGCNLRFHPAIAYIKKHLSEQRYRINEVNVYCGSNLASWRPGQDFRQSYSATIDQGGGVHLDLIHEIDYCVWLFGKPLRCSSTRRSASSLEIESYDFATFCLIYPEFSINIVLNYYRPIAKRTLEIVTSTGIIEANLLTGAVMIDGTEKPLPGRYNIAETYKAQMSYFMENIRSGGKMMNSFEEALEVLKIATN